MAIETTKTSKKNFADELRASALRSSRSSRFVSSFLPLPALLLLSECSGCILILDQGSAQMLSFSFVNGRVPVRLSWLLLITAAPLLLATEHLCAHPGPAMSPRSICEFQPPPTEAAAQEDLPHVWEGGRPGMVADGRCGRPCEICGNAGTWSSVYSKQWVLLSRVPGGGGAVIAGSSVAEAGGIVFFSAAG